MDEDLFVQHFKVSVYDNVLLLNVKADLTVRKSVYELLKKRYRPSLTNDSDS